MAEIKRGILTAIRHNMETMPRIINVFEDAKPGKKADELVYRAEAQETRQRAILQMIKGTADHNNIGKLSDYVPMILARVHAMGKEKIKQMTPDQIVELTRDIRKADAQVNLSIDWAKKFPDLDVKWLKTGRNTLESEAHKHAGKAKGILPDGTQEFYPELPMEDGEEDGGIVGTIHTQLKRPHETKNLRSIGKSEHGHNIWRVENTVKFDITKMDIARWNTTKAFGKIEKDVFEDRLNRAAAKTTPKLQAKIARVIEKMRNSDLFDNFSFDSAINWLEDIARKAMEEGYAVEQAYNLIGLAAAGNQEDADEAWKIISNMRLGYLKRRINDVDAGINKDDESISDKMRPIQQTIRLWAKSWAMAKAANSGTQDEETEKVAEIIAKKPVFDVEPAKDEDFDW